MAGRASASEYVPSPTERSVGSFFVPSVARATALGRCVAWNIPELQDWVREEAFLVEWEC